MAKFTRDPTFFNTVSNHPKVRPWVAPPSVTGDLDVSPLFDLGAIGLITKHGGFILIPKGDDVWEPHGFFLPQEDRFYNAVNDTFVAMVITFKALRAKALELRVPIGSSQRGTGDLLTKVGFQLVGGDDDFDDYRLSVSRYNSLRDEGYYDTMALHSS